MKKIDLLIIFLIFIIVCLVAWIVYNIIIADKPDGSTVYVVKPNVKKAAEDTTAGGKFLAYSGDSLIGDFSDYADAYDAVKDFDRAGIKMRGSENFIWDNYPPYNVFVSDDEYEEFDDLTKAVAFAKTKPESSLYHRQSNTLLWENNSGLPPAFQIENVGVIYQLPELPRGCEVTSLAMLINFLGQPVSKMTLADDIAKDDTLPYYKDGKLYRGNPNVGFVGDMTALHTYGLGVYHGPIYELLKNYFPENAVDLTGVDFDVLYYYIAHQKPVWIITNATFSKLGENNFETWNTQDGEIKITYKEHSVLITGYDEHYIYFADPLSGAIRAPKDNFIKAWEQMGSQAVTVSP